MRVGGAGRDDVGRTCEGVGEAMLAAEKPPRPVKACVIYAARANVKTRLADERGGRSGRTSASGDSVKALALRSASRPSLTSTSTEASSSANAAAVSTSRSVSLPVPRKLRA